jgi:hypothetical protein
MRLLGATEEYVQLTDNRSFIHLFLQYDALIQHCNTSVKLMKKQTKIQYINCLTVI